jgi:hypothetical protein
MSRRMQENIAVLLLAALFAAMIVMGLDYTPRARLVSMPVAVIGLGLALAQLAWQNFRAGDDLHVDALKLLAGRGEQAVEAVEASHAPPKARRGGRFADELAAFAMIAAVTTSFFVFGPLPTTFVFCTIYLAASRQSSWLRAALIAALVTLAIWFLFGEVLGIRIDRSLVGPMLHRMLG